MRKPSLSPARMQTWCEQHEVLLALMSHPHLLQVGRELGLQKK